MIDNLDALKNLDIFFENKIIFYGASFYGERMGNFIRGSGIEVIAYTDKDKNKCGRQKLSVPVVSIEKMLELYAKYNNLIIVVTSHSLLEICDELKKLGVDENRIFSSFSVMNSVFIHIKDKRINDKYRNEFERMYKYSSIAGSSFYNYVHGGGYYAQAWNRFHLENPILVYQFGKVGSTSVTTGLTKLGIPVVQSHALAYESGFMNQEMLEMYRFFQERIAQKDEVKIISLVREPIKRDFSFVFEHLDHKYLNIFDELTGNFVDDIVGIIENKIITDVEQIHRLNAVDYHFKYKLRGLNGNIFDWFNNELKQVFNIDVLNADFDKKKGCGVYKTENKSLLLLKTEQLSQNEHIIADFIKNSDFRLINNNRSIDKAYHFTYKNVYNSAKMPMRYLNKYLVGNKHFDMFYDNSDLEKYIR